MTPSPHFQTPVLPTKPLPWQQGQKLLLALLWLAKFAPDMMVMMMMMMLMTAELQTCPSF
jgi:hypothetical protein